MDQYSVVGRSISVGLLLGALASGALTLGGCGAGDDDLELDGRTFVSTGVTGHDLVPGTRIRVSFEGEMMAVSADCNTMTGGYRHEGGELAWTADPATTLMACDADRSAQDVWLTELFTGGVTASSTGAALLLESGEVRIDLEEA